MAHNPIGELIELAFSEPLDFDQFVGAPGGNGDRYRVLKHPDGGWGIQDRRGGRWECYGLSQLEAQKIAEDLNND